MATGRHTQLTKQVGEYLVAAELARRGLLCATFSGSVPHHDIVASGRGKGHVPVQVKAMASGSWQLDIRYFAEIRLIGRKQTLLRAKPIPYAGLVFVFVAVSRYGEDQFYILEWKKLRGILIDAYRAYLMRHKGRRPRNPSSYHTGLSAADLQKHRDQWQVITRRTSRAV
jgi:hypothetical protein